MTTRLVLTSIIFPRKYSTAACGRKQTPVNS